MLGGGGYTPQVEETITRLGGRLSYEEASEELSKMWGLRVPAETVRAITLRNGRYADEIIEAEVARIEKEAPAATKQPQQLLMSTDGAMVQLTSGEWREVKMVALGEFTTSYNRTKQKVETKTTDVSYFARVETAAAFGRSALYEWQRRGGENAKKVVSVNDGAIWIQSFIDYHCPQATRILDMAHAQGYLAKIGKAIYGTETPCFQQWYRRMRKQLQTKPPQRTLAELQLLCEQQAEHPEITELEQAFRYLQKREEMMDYAHFQKNHLPIGSGMVESGHKVVMQKRMKQAGMRWAETSLNPMLALRTALCNQTWDATWTAITAQARQHNRQRRLSRLKKDSKPVATRIVTEADCHQLTKLARQLEARSKKRPWQHHKWIFPHRAHLHQI